MAYLICQLSTKIFHKLLETDYHPNISLSLFSDKILDLNVGTNNFETFQPPFEAFSPDTLQ